MFKRRFYWANLLKRKSCAWITSGSFLAQICSEKSALRCNCSTTHRHAIQKLIACLVMEKPWITLSHSNTYSHKATKGLSVTDSWLTQVDVGTHAKRIKTVGFFYTGGAGNTFLPRTAHGILVHTLQLLTIPACSGRGSGVWTLLALELTALKRQIKERLWQMLILWLIALKFQSLIKIYFICKASVT